MNNSKRNINYKIRNVTRKKSKYHTTDSFSEGFIRRMTAPLSFSIVKLTDEQIANIHKNTGPILSDEEKMNIFMKENSM
jgi:hypothetical protein